MGGGGRFDPDAEGLARARQQQQKEAHEQTVRRFVEKKLAEGQEQKGKPQDERGATRKEGAGQ